MIRRALLIALALVGAAPAAAKPALWKLADADTTIYLFGTIHVLPPGLAWRDKAVERALESSDSLLLEAVMDTDPAAVARLISTVGKAQGLPPLAERVPPEKRALLAPLIARSGLEPGFFDGLKTWAAAMVLTGAALDEMGLRDGAEGVEPQVTRQFRAAGKPVEGLETAARQLGFLDGLSEASQRTFLAATLDTPAEARAEFDRMLKAWLAGDVRAIERAFGDEPDFTPDLKDALIRDRDVKWAAALIERLKRPGTVFMAVGAGHLVGADSVQAMLAARGFTVRRVQ